ncbi:tetratricopeptide repeat protein [Sphingomonas sp. LB-2]|uniref:tetratricopeptide repeat protein n=1 Tax=Sphingomonas caeni TaxID=2984949 RepID=UPI0022310568|nr:tetratricopeptide repeat protein [Sphingomonas caeni]MCW3849206.1 tetratricopeptide repeat protein [Sphingomonas caeni]
MKMVSTLALAAVLTLGVASPAMAQKRGQQEDPNAAPKLTVSAAFRKPAADAEKAFNAGDIPGADTALAQAEAVAKNDDEKYFAAFLRLRIEVRKQNREGIIKAADALIANPKTPQGHLPEYYFVRAQATFYSGKRADALPFLLKARELGRNDIDLPFMLAQIYGDAGKTDEAVTEMSRAIDLVKASGKTPEQNWYEWAFSRVYKSGDRTASAVWMMRIVKDFPTLANWHRMIALYRESANVAKVELGKREKMDLFRMMRATGALADQADYFNYAKAAIESGLPWEAVSVIDEGRKAGKVPANDADFARMYTGAQTAIRTDTPLETQLAQAKDGKETALVGDAFLSSGNYARALAVYDQALAKGGADANAINLHRGVALVGLGRKEEARAAFALVSGTPLGDIAKLWTVWLDLPALT